MAVIQLRSPTSAFNPNTDSILPTISQLTGGTWHILYTSLPLWKDKRNTKINYTALEPTNSQCYRLDDTITYQTVASNTIKSIRGIDTAQSPPGQQEGAGLATGGWNWRGASWLKVVSSHWEILGYGESAEEGTEWCVIWFDKTIFSPMGVDILCKGKSLEKGVVDGITTALAGLEHEGIKALAAGLFAVPHDD